MLRPRTIGIALAGCLLVSAFPARSQEESVVEAGSTSDDGSAAMDAAAGDEALVDAFAGSPEDAVAMPDDLSGFKVPGLKVDVTGSGSYVHDSNTTQTPNGPGANLFAFAYGVNVDSGREEARGGYYGIDLRGQYYVYDNAAAQMGRDPYEQFFAGHAGVNGGFTRIRMDLNYHRNNGNSLDWDYIQRETRRLSSRDYNFNLSVARDLRRGTLELGTAYALRDFDAGAGIGDGENVYGDVAWMVKPSFAPKSDLGLGFRFGTDEYAGQPSQEFLTPSFRWRWQVSGRTSFRNSIGYEMRSTDTIPSTETQNLVFDGSLDWAATAKSAVGLGYYRRVQPSYVLNGQDTTTTGFSLNLSNRLPGRFLLGTRAGFENASYFSSSAAAGVNRDDDFLRVAIDLSHPLKLTEKLRGEWSVFFNYNNNDSNLAPFSFEQDVAGIRFGLIY